VATPPGATLERTQAVLEEVQEAIVDFEEIETMSTLSGYSLLTESEGASYGMGMISLKPWEEREASVEEMILLLQDATSEVSDAEIQFFPPPTVPGFGNASGFEMQLQDKTGNELDYTAKIVTGFVDALNERPEIQNTFTNFNPNFPQYLLHVDHDQAAKLGVSVEEAMSTLQTFVGSFYASNFIRFGQLYRVMVQASPEFRSNPQDLLKLYTKNREGEMIPYSSFIKMERVFGPEQLTRYNMFTSAMINGEPAPGYSSGDAIKAVEETARAYLPRGFNYDWSGMTKEEIASGSQTIIIFMVCLFFVYMLLAAQYESYLLPLPVILSLPAGIFGSFLFLQLAGLQNNIYAQVAMVMLIGLLGKNAILIIEFAILKRQEGIGILNAAVQGATSRLRPILMTSFAFISGLIPLCFASGAGALGNRSIGVAAAGGMLVGTLVGIVLIPGLFVIFESIASKLRREEPHEEPKMA